MNSHQRAVARRKTPDVPIGTIDTQEIVTAKGVNRSHNSGPNENQLALALMAVGLVAAIVLFLIKPTRITIPLLLIAILALSIQPLLHFIKTQMLRVLVCSLVVASVIFLGWAVWPTSGAVSASIAPELKLRALLPTEPESIPKQGVATPIKTRPIAAHPQSKAAKAAIVAHAKEILDHYEITHPNSSAAQVARGANEQLKAEHVPFSWTPEDRVHTAEKPQPCGRIGILDLGTNNSFENVQIPDCIEQGIVTQGSGAKFKGVMIYHP